MFSLFQTRYLQQVARGSDGECRRTAQPGRDGGEHDGQHGLQRSGGFRPAIGAAQPQLVSHLAGGQEELGGGAGKAVPAA